MNNNDKVGDFVKEAFDTVTLEKASSHGQDSLVILGGTFAEDQFAPFLKEWGDYLDNLPWRIWVHPSRFALLHKDFAPMPTDGDAVERLHCFGDNGDLIIRRDENSFYWRFIGTKKVSWPQVAGAEDYWHDSNGSFLAVEQNYFQWRRTEIGGNGKPPIERRVRRDWAEKSPLNKDKDYVLKQIHYLDNGRIAFVRSVGFEQVEEHKT